MISRINELKDLRKRSMNLVGFWELYAAVKDNESLKELVDKEKQNISIIKKSAHRG